VLHDYRTACKMHCTHITEIRACVQAGGDRPAQDRTSTYIGGKAKWIQSKLLPPHFLASGRDSEPVPPAAACTPLWPNSASSWSKSNFSGSWLKRYTRRWAEGSV
jgi:hypothetical protein